MRRPEPTYPHVVPLGTEVVLVALLATVVGAATTGTFLGAPVPLKLLPHEAQAHHTK